MQTLACCDAYKPSFWLVKKLSFCILRFARALFSKASFDQSDAIFQFFVSLLETNSSMVEIQSFTR